MGNASSADPRHDHVIESIENLKQIPLDSQHSRKKRSVIFTTVAWKRLMEPAKKKGINLSKGSENSCQEIGQPLQPGSNPNIRHCRGLPACHDVTRKSQSLYVINTKPPLCTSERIIHTKPIFQQPRSVTARFNESDRSTMPNRYNDVSSQQSAPLTRTNSGYGKRQTLQSSSSHIVHVSQSTQVKSASVKDISKTKPQETSKSIAPRKFVIQASTSELLDCLGEFICHRCHLIKDLESIDVTTWVRAVDRALLMQGWQDVTFIMPSSVCFVFMLCREMVLENTTSVFELQCTVLTCLYMSYTYMGNEISYPLRPFLIEPTRCAFWSRCCAIMKHMSGNMLRINNDSQFFTSVFRDLKAYSPRRYVTAAPSYSCHVKAASRPLSVAFPVKMGQSVH